MPDNLRESPTAEALKVICDLDPDELQAIEPPRGSGRDPAIPRFPEYRITPASVCTNQVVPRW